MATTKILGKRSRLPQIPKPTKVSEWDFFETLPRPLQVTLEQLDLALKVDPSDREWPPEAKFSAANSLLRKMPDAEEYLSKVFEPAWQLSQTAKPATFLDLKALFDKKADNSGNGRQVTGRVLQRWGLDKASNPKRPLSVLLLDASNNKDVLVVTAFKPRAADTGKTDNFTLLASLPIGAKISVTDFKIKTSNLKYVKADFIKIQHKFELAATEAKIVHQCGDGDLLVLAISQLQFLRRFKSVEAALQLTTTKASIRRSGVPINQELKDKDGSVQRWSLDVFDKEGSTATMNCWDAPELVNRLRSHPGEGDVCMTILVPTSIKIFEETIHINVGKDVSVNIAD